MQDAIPKKWVPHSRDTGFLGLKPGFLIHFHTANGIA
jgi:hypothetical protein